MATIIVSANDPYTHGRATNDVTAKLMYLAGRLERLHAAVVNASAGYAGTAGTEFEIGNPPPVPEEGQPPVVQPAVPNLFGVQASATPGEQGTAYSYAVNRLAELWEPFWTEAKPFVEQLDNGSV